MQDAAAPPAPPTVPGDADANPALARHPVVTLVGATLAAVLTHESLPLVADAPPAPGFAHMVEPGVTAIAVVRAYAPAPPPLTPELNADALQPPAPPPIADG
jgi:hypothetical protein